MAQVTLQGVRKVYPNGFEAVKTLSLDIADGEFVVLVGPSGCGKSTTLRLIAGLEELSGGQIAIGGRIVNNIHPKDRDIAMVFQNYALYPHMTVYKNMAFALKMRGVAKPEIERRVNEAAQMLGIQDLLDKKPRVLSGGQRQRVAVGRAIVREPKAFLFDEPLSNLDAKLRVSTRAELKGLHQRLKTTTVYVTHDQEEAMTLGDRIVVMSKGLIQQAGPPLEVYRNPANRFVAGFVGTPPMNFLDGTIAREGTGLAFAVGGSGGVSIPIPSFRVGALAKYAGSPLVLGVRPHQFSDAEGPASLELTVKAVEPLGDTMDVACAAWNGNTIIIRMTAGDGFVPGMTRRFSVDMDAAHFFEPGEFGSRIVER